jgi:hypothetical protein
MMCARDYKKAVRKAKGVVRQRKAKGVVRQRMSTNIVTAQFVPELVNFIGSSSKVVFETACDRLIEAMTPRGSQADEREWLLAEKSSGDSRSDAEDADHGESVSCKARIYHLCDANFGANGRATRVAECVPILGQIVATMQLLSGHTKEAKRALAKSTKSTIGGGLAAGAAVTGGAALSAYGVALGINGGALGAVGLFGGAVAGGAAGELAGGATQALVEKAVYSEGDRWLLGTEYLDRSPAQWTAGLAVASTVGAVGASVGCHVNHEVLLGKLEQKVASELTETVATRAAAMVPGLRRMPSKRRCEVKRWKRRILA